MTSRNLLILLLMFMAPYARSQESPSVVTLQNGKKVAIYSLGENIAPYGSRFTWMDDDTVLFVGKYIPANQHTDRLTAWARYSNTDANRVFQWRLGQRVTERWPWPNFCYARRTQFIRVWWVERPADPAKYFLSGTLGAERLSVASSFSKINQFTCRAEQVEAFIYGSPRFDGLHDGDGKLEFPHKRLKVGNQWTAPPSPIVHHDEGGRITELPILDRGVLQPIFSDFDNSYFLWETRTDLDAEVELAWKGSNCKKAVRFWPGKAFEVLCLPYLEGANFFLPVPNGFIAVVSRQLSDESPGAGGIYITSGTDYLPVLRGDVSVDGMGIAVSPNGCRIALSAAANRLQAFGYRGNPQAKIIDLCAFAGAR